METSPCQAVNEKGVGPCPPPVRPPPQSLGCRSTQPVSPAWARADKGRSPSADALWRSGSAEEGLAMGNSERRGHGGPGKRHTARAPWTQRGAPAGRTV